MTKTESTQITQLAARLGDIEARLSTIEMNHALMMQAIRDLGTQVGQLLERHLDAAIGGSR